MRSILFTFFLLLSPFVFSQQAACERGDCWNGSGKFRFADGATYDGQFQRGKFHGPGIMRYRDGGLYAGLWKSGWQDGRGKLTQGDGTVYLGTFKQGRRYGEGSVTFADGNRIVGDWVDDQVAGVGTFSFTNGDRYRGKITDARLEGQGTMAYNNGDIYTGKWKGSAREGKGIMLFANGTRIEGEWRDGEFLADWGALGYQGDPAAATDCRYGCPRGTGRIRYPDGRSFVGEVLSGRPNGNGTLTYPDGNLYRGHLVDHQPEGLGVMQFADGTIHGGIWAEGQLYRRLYTASGQPLREIKPDVDEAVKVWAVVVGAARYNHMRTLRYTDDDAYQFYAFLKSIEGGALPDEQVRVLVDDDATHQNILKATREVFQRADDNDLVLFYFSGHGLPGAFLPIDYDGTYNRLEHQELQSALNASRAKHKLVIADACHSGSYAVEDNRLAAKTGSRGSALAAYYDGLGRADASTALLLSSKGEEISLEDGGLRSGIFSHYLIRGMKGQADSNRDLLISIDELFDYVHREVRSYTGNVQTPTLTGQFDGTMPVAVIRRAR